MTPLAAKVDSLLYPLETFYGSGSRGTLKVESQDAEALPQPYRRLLAHERDMTSTLEEHCGRALRLCVLQMQTRGDQVFRHVVLVDNELTPREYGAICIHQERFPAQARRDITAAERPLGTILRDHQIAYTCRPSGFFLIGITPTIREVFGVKGAGRLYGRHAELSNEAGRLLAEVVEILPPMTEQRRR
jgi:chorismate-pyruvate lyase